jgi:hypothetical protein
MVGSYGKLVAKYACFVVSRQIEIGVIRQIDYRRPICSKGVVDPKRTRHNGITNPNRKVSGEALIAILAFECQLYSRGEGLSRPHAPVESIGSTVKHIRAVIDGRLNVATLD